jgi:hypothetical protein
LRQQGWEDDRVADDKPFSEGRVRQRTKLRVATFNGLMKPGRGQARGHGLIAGGAKL